MSSKKPSKSKKTKKGTPEKKQKKEDRLIDKITFGWIPPKVKRVLWPIMLVVGLFLVFMPIIPELPYYIKQVKGELAYDRSMDFLGEPTVENGGELDQDAGEIPDENTLYIPVIGINVKIVEGTTDSALTYGAWHRPGTGTPEIGGNMVITGHRFRYLPPNNLTFYHLPKIEEGDDIIIYWNGEKYEYVVDSTFVVNPDQVEIEASTADPRVTLYTCTPLWTAKQRFVVVAKPLETADSEAEDGDTVELEEIAPEAQ